MPGGAGDVWVTPMWLKRNKPQAPPGSKRGLLWAAGAFVAGLLLNTDRVPYYVPVISLIFVGWRLLAAHRRIFLPGVVSRGLLAVLLVASVLLRFHTLNGLSAGTALLMLM